jgi:hypothetical protein
MKGASTAQGRPVRRTVLHRCWAVWPGVVAAFLLPAVPPAVRGDEPPVAGSITLPRAIVLPVPAPSAPPRGPQLAPVRPRRPTPHPAARELAPPTRQTLANTSWSGHETLNGYSTLQFNLGPDGSASMVDRDGTTPGTWEQAGSSVILRFYGGTVVYSGTLGGNRFSGTGRNQRTTWQFAVGR